MRILSHSEKLITAARSSLLPRVCHAIGYNSVTRTICESQDWSNQIYARCPHDALHCDVYLRVHRYAIKVAVGPKLTQGVRSALGVW